MHNMPSCTAFSPKCHVYTCIYIYVCTYVCRMTSVGGRSRRERARVSARVAKTESERTGLRPHRCLDKGRDSEKQNETEREKVREIESGEKREEYRKFLNSEKLGL